jgi:GT2 family glycosyltransferase
MIRVLNNDSSVGVVGPSTSNTSTSQKVRRAELCCLYWTDRQIDDFAFRYTSKYRGISTVEMDYVGGFAFIVTRSAWKASGGFDTTLTGYGNEVDLCRRLRKMGFRSVWTRESYIHHFGESSFKQYFTSEELRNQRQLATRFINSKN